VVVVSVSGGWWDGFVWTTRWMRARLHWGKVGCVATGRTMYRVWLRGRCWEALG
jgi:hypothetical protein